MDPAKWAAWRSGPAATWRSTAASTTASRRSPVTPDDSGWLLLSGVQPYRGDLVVPDIGVSLAQGTTFPSGALLNFELPLSQTRFAAGTVLPVAGTLAQPLTLPAGTILAAAVHDANGALLYPAGAAGAGRHAAGRRAPGRGQRARGDGDAGAAALACRRCRAR